MHSLNVGDLPPIWAELKQISRSICIVHTCTCVHAHVYLYSDSSEKSGTVRLSSIQTSMHVN
jgi:hypothetical protein